MHQDPPTSGARYPIRKVAEITGINPVTLRAWERRYGLIKPARTPKGHRLYSDEQIALIEHILDLVQQGVSIGQVKRMLSVPPPPAASEGTGAPALDGNDPWDHYRQRLRLAIDGFDDHRLDAAYNDCLSLYPVDLATRFLLRPLLDELERDTAPLALNRRGFFVAYLRNKLGARFHHQNGHTQGPRLIAASLGSHNSELELLLFCLSAMPRGYRFLLLSEALPEALPEIQIETGAAALLLFLDRPTLSPGLMETLHTLVQRSKMPLFLGGRLTDRAREQVRRIGISPLSEDLADAVRELDLRMAEGNPP